MSELDHWALIIIGSKIISPIGVALYETSFAWTGGASS